MGDWYKILKVMITQTSDFWVITYVKSLSNLILQTVYRKAMIHSSQITALNSLLPGMSGQFPKGDITSFSCLELWHSETL